MTNNLKADLEEYVAWCVKYALSPNDPNNFRLYVLKDDMGFIFDEFNDYQEELTDNQIAAVLGN